MNPYIVGYTIGTGVGLTYELDLDEAATRSAIVTGLSYAVQTPAGRKVVRMTGLATYAITKDLIVAPAATALGSGSAAAIGTGLTYAGAVVGGAVIGAAVGTAISSKAFGQAGKEKAIKFYTGQANNWYDYVPYYNAFKIARHYGSEIIE